MNCQKNSLNFIETIFFISGLFFFFACVQPQEIGDSKEGSSTTIESAKGSLELTIRDYISDRYSAEIDLNPVMYLLDGKSPEGIDCSWSVNETRILLDSLSEGTWTMAITAFNANGIAIGGTNFSLTIVKDEVVSKTIGVKPYAGNGILTLTLDWNNADLNSPSVAAELIPFVGDSQNLDFSLSGSYATFSANDIPAGEYGLIILLQDGGETVAGTAALVTIVQDIETTSAYSLDLESPYANALSVHDVQNLLDVSIEDASDTKYKIVDMDLTSSLSGYGGNVISVWSVDGNIAGIGEDFVFDAEYGAGEHLVTVTMHSVEDNLYGSDSVSIEVISPNETDYFVSVWDTTKHSFRGSENDQIKLPLVPSGYYNFVIDWGDGNADEITSFYDSDIEHTYADGGIYTIRIAGTIKGFCFEEEGNDECKILEISQFGCLNLGAEGAFFRGCENLVISATDALCLKDTNSLSYCFYDCNSLSRVPSMNEWDVSNITDMRYMFYNANQFDQDISSWDVSSVTDMQFMFCNANQFDQDLANWDVVNVTDMKCMFCKASAFNQDISDWDVGNVTDMNSMFYCASAFNQDISDWDVSSVRNMGGMFSQASVFNVDISGWDVSSVTNMSSMFANASVFNQSLSSWDVSSVISMQFMFYCASAFNQDISSWDVSSVLYMNSMFNQASVFNQNLSKWNISNVINVQFMFCRATVFNQDLSDWNVVNVTDMKGMFDLASAFNQDISGWDVANVTDMSSMFYCASAFDQGISSWDVANVTDMSSMFYCASAFNQDISSWDVTNVTDMNSMFYKAVMFDQNISFWNISNICDMWDMFCDVRLSVENYDAILNGWAAQDVPLGIRFHGGESQYSTAAEDAHQKLSNEYHWFLFDGGQVGEE